MGNNRENEIKTLINKVEMYKTALKKMMLRREQLEFKLEEIQTGVKERLDGFPQNKKILVTALRNIIPLANYQFIKMDEEKDFKQMTNLELKLRSDRSGLSK